MAELLGVMQVLDKLRPHRFTRLQRLLLTQTGTVEMALSACFLREVRVIVVGQQDNNGVIHRFAQLQAGDTVVCEFEGHINITCEDVRQEVLASEMGLTDILETLGIYPRFKLLDVGQDEARFWRTCRLEDPGVHCRVTEVFPRDIYVEEQALKVTFHEVNNTAWDQLWSWLLEEDYL